MTSQTPTPEHPGKVALAEMATCLSDNPSYAALGPTIRSIAAYVSELESSALNASKDPTIVWAGVRAALEHEGRAADARRDEYEEGELWLTVKAALVGVGRLADSRAAHHAARLADYERQAEVSREAIFARADAAEMKIAILREALDWYAERVAGCRLIHSGGDPDRNALAKDGGRCARAALSLTAPASTGGRE